MYATQPHRRSRHTEHPDTYEAARSSRMLIEARCTCKCTAYTHGICCEESECIPCSHAARRQWRARLYRTTGEESHAGAAVFVQQAWCLVLEGQVSQPARRNTAVCRPQQRRQGKLPVLMFATPGAAMRGSGRWRRRIAVVPREGERQYGESRLCAQQSRREGGGTRPRAAPYRAAARCRNWWQRAFHAAVRVQYRRGARRHNVGGKTVACCNGGAKMAAEGRQQPLRPARGARETARGNVLWERAKAYAGSRNAEQQRQTAGIHNGKRLCLRLLFKRPAVGGEVK